MGMRDYAVNDYGMIMTKEIMKAIASQVCQGYTDDAYDEDEEGFNEDLYEKGLVDRIGEFTGESMEINDDGTTEWETGETYNYDQCYYLPVSNYPSLFNVAYNNINEMIDDFKEKIGEYLPKDFDYREYVRHIVGTYFG